MLTLRILAATIMIAACAACGGGTPLAPTPTMATREAAATTLPPAPAGYPAENGFFVTGIVRQETPTGVQPVAGAYVEASGWCNNTHTAEDGSYRIPAVHGEMLITVDWGAKTASTRVTVPSNMTIDFVVQ